MVRLRGHTRGQSHTGAAGIIAVGTVLPNCTDLQSREQTPGSCSPHRGSAMFSLKRHLRGKTIKTTTKKAPRCLAKTSPWAKPSPTPWPRPQPQLCGLHPAWPGTLLSHRPAGPAVQGRDLILNLYQQGVQSGERPPSLGGTPPFTTTPSHARSPPHGQD